MHIKITPPGEPLSYVGNVLNKRHADDPVIFNRETHNSNNSRYAWMRSSSRRRGKIRSPSGARLTTVFLTHPVECEFPDQSLQV